MLRGFDVSFLTDWPSLQSRYGLSFGFVRCMREGEAEDVAFRAAWRQMGTLPAFVRGAYAFASPALDSDAVDDARLFWSYIRDAGAMQPTDLFCLDLEKSPLTQDETNDWAEEWFDEFVRVNRAAGYAHTPGVYMGQGYLMNRTGARLNERFAWLWYPRPQTEYDTAWPASFTPRLPTGAASWADTAWGRPPEFWQTAFHWPIPGAPDHDADLFAGDLAALTALNQGGSMRTPYGRTTFRGVTLNWRTAEMLVVAEKKISIAPLELSQGSWSLAATSGGTHAGGGALDVRASKGGNAFTRTQLDEIQLELRRIGFAAWVRTPAQGDWPYHVHAIAIGDRDMSDQAAQQVTWYKQGLNGLWPPAQGPDYGPAPIWTQYPQTLTELEMDATEHAALMRVDKLLATVDVFPNDLTDAAGDTLTLASLLRLDRSRLYAVAADVNRIDTNTSKALTQLAAVLAAPGVLSAGDVDEAALAAAIAPLLTTNVGSLTDEALAQVADAVADEEGRRAGAAVTP